MDATTSSVHVIQLTRFLTSLSLAASTNAVAKAVATVALRTVEPYGVMLHTTDHTGSLLLAGEYQLPTRSLSLFRSLPLTLPSVITDAFNHDTALTLHMNEAAESYLILDHPLIGAITDLWGPWQHTAVPIRNHDEVVGVLSVAHPEWEWNPNDFLVLDAIATTIGMWLGGLEDGSQSTHHPLAAAPSPLTAQQVHVLSCISEGLTNPAIASALGISQSLVKVEIHRTMRLLGTSTREATARRAYDLGLMSRAVGHEPVAAHGS